MSEVSICNIALTELGAEPLVALADETKTARLCSLHYPIARDDLLSNYRWNFGLRRKALVALTEAPVFGFTRKFQMPADILRLWDTDLEECDWHVVDDELETDAEAVSILYSAKVTDTAKFSTGFRRSLELSIAARIGFSITRLPQTVGLMESRFQDALADARTFESQENSPETMGPGSRSIITARFRGSSFPLGVFNP